MQCLSDLIAKGAELLGMLNCLMSLRKVRGAAGVSRFRISAAAGSRTLSRAPCCCLCCACGQPGAGELEGLQFLAARSFNFFAFGALSCAGVQPPRPVRGAAHRVVVRPAAGHHRTGTAAMYGKGVATQPALRCLFTEIPRSHGHVVPILHTRRRNMCRQGAVAALTHPPGPVPNLSL